MGWNGEDQTNAQVAAAPTTVPLGVPGPFDRADWFDRLAAMHFKGLCRSDAYGRSENAAAWLPLIETRSGARASLANWYSFVPTCAPGCGAAQRA